MGKRTQEGYAWLYWDCRRQSRDGYWFTMLGNHEIDRAIGSLSSAAALKMYLYICKVSNGRTSYTCPDGVAIGEAMIAEACGISRASMYRATKELRAAGLLQVSKVGAETRALLVSPQAPDVVDLRQNPESEKKEEKIKKLQSQIQDCEIVPNMQAGKELCQNSQSYIWHNDQKLAKASLVPPIIPQAAAKQELEIIETPSSPLAGAPEDENQSRGDESLALKGVYDISSMSTLERALLKFAVKADNLERIKENPAHAVALLCAKSLKNGRSLLQSYGYEGKQRKSTVLTALSTLMETHLSSDELISHYRSQVGEQYYYAADEDKQENAGEIAQRTAQPLQELHLLEYEKSIAELPAEETPGVSSGFGSFLDGYGEAPRLLEEIEVLLESDERLKAARLADGKSVFTISPHQRIRLIRCWADLQNYLFGAHASQWRD